MPINAYSYNRLGLSGATLNRNSHLHSVDTAVAISAGSDRPTVMMLSDPPDWRWRPVPEDPKPLWYPHQEWPPNPRDRRTLTRIIRAFQSAAMIIPCSQRPFSPQQSP